jgi:hypothetical protein
MKSFLPGRKILRGLGISIGIAGCFYLSLLVLFRPSHDRDWQLGHESLPRFVDTGNGISIENFRNFVWTDTKTAKIQYEKRIIDLDEMTGVDVLISHFADFEGLAHIFLSFGFAEGERVVVSIETRRETDETFSPLLGILRQFEIIYVVGSEEDIVGVRTGHRNERVYLYPTKATPQQARELFALLVEDINEVYEQPRMYNTLTRNCTNELTRPVEVMSDVDFPLTWKTILPGYFDEILYELGLISNDAPFEEVKAAHLIDNETVDARSATYSADLRKMSIN